MPPDIFGDVYAGRRVMVTGHTGFLGCWAVRWLAALGAEVAGYSRGQREAGALQGATACTFEGDIADAQRLAAAMAAFQPEIILHLAGSTVVAAGYRAPAATFTSNVAGTVAVLDEATRQASVRCVVVTGTPAATRLGDDLELGPYAASKLAVEACLAAYGHRLTQQAAGRPEPLRIGLARPGVMIGGDWAEGRLLADVVRAVRDGNPVTLAAPGAVRPWQHVLDGVSGVLILAVRLWAGPAPRRRYDFGCEGRESGGSVHEVVSGFLAAYGVPRWPVRAADDGASDRVELGYAAAHADLAWRPVWALPQALEASAQWYRAAVGDPAILAVAMDDLIATYATCAGRAWAPAMA
jgi:CDP-glucose 4,6-dehydratase